MTRATYTFVEATEFNFPNITIYKKIRDTDNVQTAWRANANEGYVFYDSADPQTRWDEETQQEITEFFYYREVSIPLRFNFDNFTWVAILESEVDNPNNIFGGGDNNDHEKA